jgi:hypothetical protein
MINNIQLKFNNLSLFYSLPLNQCKWYNLKVCQGQSKGEVTGVWPLNLYSLTYTNCIIENYDVHDSTENFSVCNPKTLRRGGAAEPISAQNPWVFFLSEEKYSWVLNPSKDFFDA